MLSAFFSGIMLQPNAYNNIPVFLTGHWRWRKWNTSTHTFMVVSCKPVVILYAIKRSTRFPEQYILKRIFVSQLHDCFPDFNVITSAMIMISSAWCKSNGCIIEMIMLGSGFWFFLLSTVRDLRFLSLNCFRNNRLAGSRVEYITSFKIIHTKQHWWSWFKHSEQ